MIYRWVNKFRNHGTVHNLNRIDTNRQSHSGRPKSSRTPHNVAAVRDSVVHSSSKSVRRRSQELGINRKSVRRILIADLYPYRIQIKQKLTPDDMRKRVIMWQWFCDKIDSVPDFLDNVWFSEEAHFLLSGNVNSKNNIFWGSTPPEHCLQRPLHSVKCTAWVPVVPAGWCHPPLSKRITGMATAAFPWPTDQPQVWPAVVAVFTGLESPRFLYVGIP